MKRYFSVVEEVRSLYVVEVNDIINKLDIENIAFNTLGGWELVEPLDFIKTSFQTIEEKDIQWNG